MKWQRCWSRIPQAGQPLSALRARTLRCMASWEAPTESIAAHEASPHPGAKADGL